MQTIRDWHRMCKTFTTDNDESCCDGCPIMALEIDEHGCDAIFSEWADKADWEEVEDVIKTWAAEHPAPVYPSIAKYLEQFGIIIRRDGSLQADFFKAHEPMSADMAQRLGVEPKEK